MRQRPRLFGDRRVRRHGDPSGLAVAERVHARAHVDTPAPLPVCDVTIGFSIHGTREHAESVAGTVAYAISKRTGVNRVSFTTTERP